MRSLALGKLLSGGSSKTTNHENPTPRRGRALNTANGWRPADRARQSPQIPSPAIDPSGRQENNQISTDSYFGPVKRRGTGQSDRDFNDTDDYGLPVTDTLPSPQILTPILVDSDRPAARNKCRTCEKVSQLAAWKCDVCHTYNSSTANGKVPTSDAPIKQLSVSKSQDVFDQKIASSLKKVELDVHHVPAVPAVPAIHDGAVATSEGLSNQSMLAPPKLPAQIGHRRGSAPDTSRVPLSTHNGRPHSQHQSSTRRPPPGPLALPANSHQRVGHGSPLPSPNPTSNKAPLPSPDVRTAQRHGASSTSRSNTDPFRIKMRTEASRDACQPVFDWLVDTVTRRNLNISFSTVRKHHPGRSYSEGPTPAPVPEPRDVRSTIPIARMTQMDHKDLMIGDVYDVASSLVGNQPFRKSTPKQVPASAESLGMKLVNQGSPHLDWKHLQRWYEVILSVGILDKDPRVADLRGDESDKPLARTNSRKVQLLEELGSSIRGGMLDLTEQLLSSQQTAPTEPQEIRYLLILLANPLLTNPKEYSVRHSTRTRSSALPPPDAGRVRMDRQSSPQRKVQKWLWNPSKQSRCLSLILGILSNLSADCHIHLIAWFSRYPEDEFRQHVDSILSFVNDRIALRRIAPPSPRKGTKPSTYGGIPTSQMFDDVLHSNIIPILDANSDDWQLRSACKVLQLFVRANDKYHARSPSDKHSGGVSSNQRRKSPTKQLISTEHFYTSQLDSPDKFNPMDDFDAWEKKHAGFHLCQYPFLLTLGTKIKILEFDAKRKMADKARQEFFNSMFRQGTSAEKFFHLSVRRKCIIEDSLQRVSEAISSSQEEAKKALKVRFEGEEGVDAGGLRKEWFLLLVRELFDPDVGLFLYNEQSNLCYFNPHSLESSEQYQLVGAVLGLAIYNFTILDVPFPPFLFRKLAAAAPPSMGDLHQGWRPTWRPSVDDLSEYDPDLARHLKQILEYEGNVANDIVIFFEVDTVHYGKVQHHCLVDGGDRRLVTNKTREEYVDLYVDYALEKSIRKQFEPFARGFYKVCHGNALSLFRGEEIELLIRGSGELDFVVLRGSATYENWKLSETGQDVVDGEAVEANFPVVKWFWQLMAMAEPDDQRRILRWITGSDRIPATGIGSLILRIQCLGEDCDRLPQARTCFNMLQLWNYGSRTVFIRKFWYAVVESEGFGLK